MIEQDDRPSAQRWHLETVHGLDATRATEIAGATASQACQLCDAWLRRQLEGLGK